jgi:hypothetical protein
MEDLEAGLLVAEVVDGQGVRDGAKLVLIQDSVEVSTLAVPDVARGMIGDPEDTREVRPVE